MKYAYAFFAALLVVGASAFPLSFDDHAGPISQLDRDLIEFLKLIPQKEAERVIHEHAEDPELWESLKYLLTNDFHQLVYAAEDLPEFQRHVLYLQAAGYNAIRELRLTHKALGMKEYKPPKPQTEEVMAIMKKGGGFSGLIDDFVAILPKEEIKALHAKKLKESPAFAKFSAAILSPEFAEIRAALGAQKPMQSLLEEAKAHGIDFLKYNNLRAQVLGFA